MAAGTESIRAKRHNRVHVRRLPSKKNPGQQANHQEERSGSNEGERIGFGDSEQHRPQQSGGQKSRWNADSQSDHREDACVPDHRPCHHLRIRSHRDAHANLTRATAHGIGQHAIECLSRRARPPIRPSRRPVSPSSAHSLGRPRTALRRSRSPGHTPFRFPPRRRERRVQSIPDYWSLQSGCSALKFAPDSAGGTNAIGGRRLPRLRLPTTPTMVMSWRSRSVPNRMRRCSTSAFGRNFRARLSVTMQTRAAAALSDHVKKRPAISGVPTVSKNPGDAVSASDRMSTRARRRTRPGSRGDVCRGNACDMPTDCTPATLQSARALPGNGSRRWYPSRTPASPSGHEAVGTDRRR